MNRYNAYFNMIHNYFKKKKTQLVIELLLEKYNNRNFYIRVDYFKKDRIYKLSFIDLDHIESNNLEAWINTCIVDPNNMFFIEDLFNNTDFKNIYLECEDHHVYINAYYKRFTHIEFYRFLPMELYQLTDLLIILFNNCPKRIEGYFFELTSLITNNKNKYEYDDELKFDLFKGKLDKLFNEETIKRGTKYYEDDQIKFIEKLDTQYLAVIEGADDYVVILDYNEKDKKIKMFCSCPEKNHCKHIYATILAIRNKLNKPFYKLEYKKPNTTYLNRLMHFNYYLCTGIEGHGIKIINKDGNIEAIPLLDMDHTCNFTVIEDDNNLTLSKEIANITYKG